MGIKDREHLTHTGRGGTGRLIDLDQSGLFADSRDVQSMIVRGIVSPFSLSNLNFVFFKSGCEKTYLHQQLSAEGIVVVVGEDLGQLAEGAKTLPG